MPIDLRMLRDAFTLARQACPGEEVMLRVYAKTQPAFDYAAGELKAKVRTVAISDAGQEFDSAEVHLDATSSLTISGPRRPRKEAA